MSGRTGPRRPSGSALPRGGPRTGGPGLGAERGFRRPCSGTRPGGVTWEQSPDREEGSKCVALGRGRSREEGGHVPRPQGRAVSAWSFRSGRQRVPKEMHVEVNARGVVCPVAPRDHFTLQRHDSQLGCRSISVGPGGGHPLWWAFSSHCEFG